MNNFRRLRIALPVLLAAACLPAFGQKYEIGPYFVFDRMSRGALGTNRSVGGNDGDTRWNGHGNGFGLRLTLNTKGYYGHEISYERSHIPLTSNLDEFVFNADGTITLGNAVDRKEKVRQSRLSYNFLLYMMPAGERWRPYITVGVSTLKTDAPRFIEWTVAGSRNFGANYGAGIKVMPIKKLGALIRLDARHVLAGSPYALTFPSGITQKSLLSQLEFSGGVSYAFGK